MRRVWRWFDTDEATEALTALGLYVAWLAVTLGIAGQFARVLGAHYGWPWWAAYAPMAAMVGLHVVSAPAALRAWRESGADGA